MTVEEEWENLIDGQEAIYIYGAGNIGRKILKLLKRTDDADKKVKGFLVSDLTGNPLQIEEYPVMIPENILNRTSLILVSVTDIYQDNIISDLKSMGFQNTVVAYKYSFMVDDPSSDFPRTMVVDTKELMLCQYRNNLFNRYDIVLRLLAVEHYYGKNTYGFPLYEKMQSARIRDESYGAISRQRFTGLIQSFERNGYQDDSELVFDEKLQLVDGSHRLALALYFGISRLKVRIVNRKEETWYGSDWFAEIFSYEEYKLIEEKKLKCEKQWFGLIKGILWPSAADYFDEIIKIIEQQYKVTNIEDFVFDSDGFREIVYRIYQIDSIAEWKINTKLKYMAPFLPHCIRIFDIDMGNPEFRMKKAGVGILSGKGAELKEKIREMYMGKIPGYFSDIIFHTADNFYQSRYIKDLFHEKVCK